MLLSPCQICIEILLRVAFVVAQANQFIGNVLMGSNRTIYLQQQATKRGTKQWNQVSVSLQQVALECLAQVNLEDLRARGKSCSKVVVVEKELNCGDQENHFSSLLSNSFPDLFHPFVHTITRFCFTHDFVLHDCKKWSHGCLELPPLQATGPNILSLTSHQSNHKGKPHSLGNSLFPQGPIEITSSKKILRKK